MVSETKEVKRRLWGYVCQERIVTSVWEAPRCRVIELLSFLQARARTRCGSLVRKQRGSEAGREGSATDVLSSAPHAL